MRGEAKCGHSFVPGQCRHHHVSKEREQEALGQTPAHPDPKNDEKINRRDSDDEVQTAGNQMIPKLVQPCIFEMNEKLFIDGNQVKIHKYTSIEDYNQFSFKVENIGSLSGCFDKDNTLG